MDNIITFDQALDISKNRKRHLLLGNGFSIACVPTIFTYISLFIQADFSKMPQVEQVFKQLNTRDFETVIKTLLTSSQVLEVYDNLNPIVANLRSHADELKKLLIETIAGNHPSVPSEIDDTKKQYCSSFISKFLDNKGSIYTLNYDLLLYWTLMFAMEKKLITETPNDGFGNEAPYTNYLGSDPVQIIWKGESNAHNQNIHYLHGALHLYDLGSSIEKFTWTNKAIPLMRQIETSLKQDNYPLFVAEGTSNEKMSKITHSGYLYHSYKSFSMKMEVGKNSDAALFTYGFSFSDNDSHIIKKIRSGYIRNLFVSIYGTWDSGDNIRIYNAVNALNRSRAKDKQINIYYYDAASAKVWG